MGGSCLGHRRQRELLCTGAGVLRTKTGRLPASARIVRTSVPASGGNGIFHGGATFFAGVTESRMRVHQAVRQRGHLAFEQFLDRISRFLLRSLPFREVQDGSAFLDVVLNEPGPGAMRA